MQRIFLNLSVSVLFFISGNLAFAKGLMLTGTYEGMYDGDKWEVTFALINPKEHAGTVTVVTECKVGGRSIFNQEADMANGIGIDGKEVRYPKSISLGWDYYDEKASNAKLGLSFSLIENLKNEGSEVFPLFDIRANSDDDDQILVNIGPRLSEGSSTWFKKK